MLSIGIGTVDFTPAPGLPLMGNFRDDYLARGVHDPLLAKALVFAGEQGVQAAVLALDICMLARDNVALLRRTAAAQCGIAPENVLVHATHTHSAPAPCDRYLFGLDFSPFRAQTDALLTTAAGAVARAVADLAPAALAVGSTREDRLSFNRRLRRHDGSTQMNWEALAPGFDPSGVAGAWGPIDPELQCLTVRRTNGAQAAVVNFGLHPAILAGDNWLYSADYPGVLADALRRMNGPDFTTLFLNGCCGNVNHCDYRDPQQGRGYGMVERVGSMLAVSAMAAMRAAQPTTGQRVAAASTRVTLNHMPIPEAERQRCEAVMEAARRSPARGQVDGLPEAFFADLRLTMYAKQHQPDPVEVMAIRVGDVAIVGLPGEVFCELGLEIKRRSAARHTLVLGLANDAIGYLPTRASFAQGGYEPTVGSTLYEPGSAERLVDAAVSLLDQLFECKSA